MLDWLPRLQGLLGRGMPAVSVTVIEVLGSAPCLPGSRMLVTAGHHEGTIGGGNLEYVALEQARKLIDDGRRALRQSLPLGPVLAQCCGGRVTLLFERYALADMGFLDGLAGADLLATRVRPEAYGKIAYGGGAAWTLAPGDPAIARAPSASPELPRLEADLWLEHPRPPVPRVCIFGAGHIGRALARVLGVVPCEIVLIDARRDMTHCAPSTVRIVESDDPDAMDGWWRPGALAVVLTHSHELDFRWVSAILRRRDAGYCGLIGSKTKRARFLRRLPGDGLDAADLDRMTCPIGLPGLASKDPGAVAISVAAQLLPFLAGTAPAAPAPAPACDCTPSAFNRTLEQYP